MHPCPENPSNKRSPRHRQIIQSCSRFTKPPVSWCGCSRWTNSIIMKNTPLTSDQHATTLYENNSACAEQMGAGFIRAHRPKHIDPQILNFTQDLIRDKQLEIKKIASTNNIVNLLTKALPGHTHRRLVHMAGMRLLHELT